MPAATEEQGVVLVGTKRFGQFLISLSSSRTLLMRPADGQLVDVGA
jgi:hypothetical protein